MLDHMGNRYSNETEHFSNADWIKQFSNDDWIKPKFSNKPSKIWEHFLVNRINKNFAKCIYCVPGQRKGGIVKCTNHQTTGLHYHLLHTHGIKVDKVY